MLRWQCVTSGKQALLLLRKSTGSPLGYVGCSYKLKVTPALILGTYLQCLSLIRFNIKIKEFCCIGVEMICYRLSYFFYVMCVNTWTITGLFLQNWSSTTRIISAIHFSELLAINASEQRVPRMFPLCSGADMNWQPLQIITAPYNISENTRFSPLQFKVQ